MKGEILYPNIAHFVLAKEMPSAKIGTIVTIADNDGSERLYINEFTEDGVCFGEGISLDIGFAKRYPEWFTPITKEEHYKKCNESAVNYFISKGRTREVAERLVQEM